MDCVFCKIVNGEIPARKVHEDQFSVAFHDSAPQAPVHVLLIPKQHTETTHLFGDAIETLEIGRGLAGWVFSTIPEITRKVNLNDYRITINRGPGSGQVVSHFHIHILGGWDHPPSI